MCERCEELEEALWRISQWADAYPNKAFPEPDLKKAGEILKAAGLTLDSVSASAMRHVVVQVSKIAKEALKED